MPCRLAALVQQEGAAKAAADNVSAELRKQVDDLQTRLQTSIASEDAAKREVSVYKQQVTADILSCEYLAWACLAVALNDLWCAQQNARKALWQAMVGAPFATGPATL